MEEYVVTIESLAMVTHDVIRIRTGKVAGLNFIPGQATEISVDKPGWLDERRPFTFTSLPWEDHLEFTIKTYPMRQGVTNQLLQLKKGDRLILHEVFGAIQYAGEGVFIAGGAGVTPFIAIFRYLNSKNSIGKNMLVFANKTREDIILENEFSTMLGDAFVNILSDAPATEKYHSGYISENFLREVVPAFNRRFYVCGPPPMIDSVLDILNRIGVDNKAITIEI